MFQRLLVGRAHRWRPVVIVFQLRSHLTVLHHLECCLRWHLVPMQPWIVPDSLETVCLTVLGGWPQVVSSLSVPSA